MDDVVYTSIVRIERQGGPVRLAWLPGEKEPVTFGVHGAIAQHYGVAPDAFTPHATTIDSIVGGRRGMTHRYICTSAGSAQDRRREDLIRGEG